MAMSKKDYQAIAGAMFEHRQTIKADDSPIERHVAGMLRLADALGVGNPRFDRARFLEACETGTCKGMRKAS
jgi:hypothetical protein